MTVYPALADRLAEQLPALWIDLDQDQLNPDRAGQDYALPYDVGVLLISFDEVEWEDRGGEVQVGDAVIRVTLARQVVQDTYQRSSQRAAALQQLQLLADVHKALHHYAAPDGQAFGALVRTYSRKEPSTIPGLWVYSMGYRCRLFDADAHQPAGLAEVPDVAPSPVPRIIRRAVAEEGSVILP